MRLIKVYVDKYWTSLSAMASAVLSEEDVVVVHYGGWSAKSNKVIYEAAEQIKKWIWSGVIYRLNNLFWMGALLAGVMWPLLKLPTDIQRFFVLLVGAAFMVALVRLLGTFTMRYKFGRFDLGKLVHVEGPPELTPPPMAHRERDIKTPSVRRSLMFFVLMVFMNCWVLASPAYPAKLDDYYVEANVLVAPWVVWESTVKIEQGSMIAIVTAPETDQIWIARATYVVQRTGDGDIEWLDWTTNRLSWLVSQITQDMSQSMPADITAETVVSWILEAWEQDFDGEIPLGILRDAMIANFQERFVGEYELLLLEIEIEHISLSKYRKEVQ